VASAVAADGKHVWTVSLDGDKVRYNDAEKLLWDNPTALGGQPVALAAANKDPNLAVCALFQNKIVTLRSGKVVTPEAISYRPCCIAFSADDQFVAVGGEDKKVHIYKVDTKAATLKESAVYTGGHLGRVLTVRWSADSKFLVSADSSRMICIFDSAGKQQNSTSWTFHNASVTEVAWPASGSSQLATCSQDQDVLVWTDLKTFEHQMQRIQLAHPLGVDHVAFVDDNTLITSGADRAIRVWSRGPTPAPNSPTSPFKTN